MRGAAVTTRDATARSANMKYPQPKVNATAVPAPNHPAAFVKPLEAA
jgi:hypothetical protein